MSGDWTLKDVLLSIQYEKLNSKIYASHNCNDVLKEKVTTPQPLGESNEFTSQIRDASQKLTLNVLMLKF